MPPAASHALSLARRNALMARYHAAGTTSLAELMDLTQLSRRSVRGILAAAGPGLALEAAGPPRLSAAELRDLRRSSRGDPEALAWLALQAGDRRRNGKLYALRRDDDDDEDGG